MQLLADNGLEAHQIMTVTRYKSGTGVQSSWKATSEDQNLCSTVLSNAGDNASKDTSEKYMNGQEASLGKECSALRMPGSSKTAM